MKSLLIALTLLTASSAAAYSITLHNHSDDPVTFIFFDRSGEIARETVPGSDMSHPSGFTKPITLDDATCIAKVEAWSTDEPPHQVFPDGLFLVHPEGCKNSSYIDHIGFCAPQGRSSVLFYTKTPSNYEAQYRTICGEHNN